MGGFDGAGGGDGGREEAGVVRWWIGEVRGLQGRV